MTGSYFFHRTETALFWEDSSTNFFLLTLPPFSAVDSNPPYLPGTSTEISNASLYLFAANTFFPVIVSRCLSTEKYPCDVRAGYPILYCFPIYPPTCSSLQKWQSQKHILCQEKFQLFPFLSADWLKFAELRNTAWGSQAFVLNAVMGFLLESIPA